jgi:hypothetical protein
MIAMNIVVGAVRSIDARRMYMAMNQRACYLIMVTIDTGRCSPVADGNFGELGVRFAPERFREVVRLTLPRQLHLCRMRTPCFHGAILAIVFKAVPRRRRTTSLSTYGTNGV